MKKVVLAFICLMVCITLVGCGNQNASISSNITNKIDKLENTINTIKFATNEDILLTSTNHNINEIQQAGIFNKGPIYPNINSYGNYYGGMYGMYPYGGFGGYSGYGAYMPYYPYGYNNFSNPAFNNVGFNTINNPAYRNITNGIFPSNIDTYRINSITKDGKTTTTINTYKDGKQIDSRTEEYPAQTTNTRLQNLSSVCNSCLASNNYSEQLKNEVLNNIQNVRQSASKIKNNGIKLTSEQKSAINEHLNSISHLTSKINMNKGEYNTELKNVKSSKAKYTLAPSNISAKYLKLMSCIDSRNAQMQSVLNSLVGLNNCINNQTQESYYWNTTTTNNNSQSQNLNNNCDNCISNDCSNCPDCSSCTTCNDCSNCANCENCNNCTNCINCSNCEDCKDCENCINCKGLIGAKNCIDNKCQDNNSNEQILPNENSEVQNKETNNQNLDTNNNSQNSSTDNNQDISNDDNIIAPAPSIAEIPVTDNKTSETTIKTNHFEPNIEETRTENDNIIEDKLINPAKEVIDDVKDSFENVAHKTGQPKPNPPIDKRDIIQNGDAENSEFLSNEEDNQVEHNKYINENLELKERRLERIREHQRNLMERKAVENKEHLSQKESFRVEYPNQEHNSQTPTHTGSISNENPYENNKGLTA